MNQGTYDLRRDVDKLFNTFSSSKEYKIIPNAPAIMHLEGAYKPSSITFTSYASSHDGTDFYDGKLEVKYSTDGVTYTRDGSIATGHTITRTITSDTVNYVKCILYDSKNNVLDEQTVPVIRSDSAINIVIGNEAQIIPCSSNGSLKEVFTFNVPVYCFKGSDYYPATYSSSDSSYNTAFTLMSTTNPTSSNAGNVSIRVDSAPTDNQGFCVLGFTVDGELITKKVSWAKVGDGVNGSNGMNGSGYQTVYCISDTETTPSAPTSSTTIYNTPPVNADNGLIEWQGGRWYNTLPEVSIERPYCWQSKRMYENSAWGNYQTPTLYTHYSRDGSNGNDGSDGRDGRDGTELTGDDIMTLIEGQNIDAQSIGGIPIDGLMTTQVFSSTIKDGNNDANCTVMKMGKLCILNFVNFKYTFTTINNNYYAFESLPTWAYPPSTMYILSVPNGERLSINSDGDIRIWTYGRSTGEVVSLSGFFVYFAKDNVSLKTTSITFDNSTVQTSSPVTITLKRTNESGQLEVFKDASVEFEVGGSVYTRQTNSNGKASLNLNLNAGTYSVTAKYKKDQVNASTTTTQNVTVTAISSPTLTIYSNYATLMNSSTPLQNVPCIITVKTDTYSQNTDYTGKIDLKNILANYKGSVSVKVETNNTGRCTYTSATATLTGTKTIEEHKTTLSPSSIGGDNLNTNYAEKNGTKWNYATVGSLTFKNDGAYAITDILSNNTTAGALDISFTISTTDMPTNAVIKRVTAYVRYASLRGWTNASKGSYNQGESKISLLRGDATTGGAEKNFVINTLGQSNVGTWYEVGYQWDINETNTSNRWNYPALHFTGITNRGGGFGNNSRFGIDYAQLIIEYEA